MRPALRITILALSAAVCILVTLPACAQDGSVGASQCAKLQQLTLDHAHVLSAQMVAPGQLVAPPGPKGKAVQLPLYSKLPAFCRVIVEATPTSDSSIKIEVWLPTTGWNSRLQGTGNGGFAGAIDYRVMAALAEQRIRRHRHRHRPRR